MAVVPLWFGLRASWPVTVSIVALHCAAISSIMLAQLAKPVVLLVGAAVAASAALAVNRHGLRLSRAAIVYVRINSSGQINLKTRSGFEYDATLGPHCYVNRWFVVLQLRSKHGAPRRLFVAETMVATDTLRRLRVFLRTRTSPHGVSR